MISASVMWELEPTFFVLKDLIFIYLTLVQRRILIRIQPYELTLKGQNLLAMGVAHRIRKQHKKQP